MKFIKKFYNFIFFIVKTTLDGAVYVADFTAKGFYYYFYVMFKFLRDTFHFKFLENITNYFKGLQEQSDAFLLLLIYVFSFCALYNIAYKNNRMIKIDEEMLTNIVDSNSLQNNDDEEYVSLFKKYGDYSLNEVSINDLRTINEEVVGWLAVDSTNVNYPIVQTKDNDFYLNHSFDKSFKLTGWTFMDYRNNIDLSDDNTIFYGHNLINDTSFGSIGNIFREDWINDSNHKIVFIDSNNKKHYYEVFSYYYSDSNSNYLVTNFYTDIDKCNFLNILKSKSLFDFNISLTEKDKIITLSTYTDDNLGREVVHAVLVN